MQLSGQFPKTFRRGYLCYVTKHTKAFSILTSYKQSKAEWSRSNQVVLVNALYGLGQVLISLA